MSESQELAVLFHMKLFKKKENWKHGISGKKYKSKLKVDKRLNVTYKIEKKESHPLHPVHYTEEAEPGHTQASASQKQSEEPVIKRPLNITYKIENASQIDDPLNTAFLDKTAAEQAELQRSVDAAEGLEYEPWQQFDDDVASPLPDLDDAGSFEEFMRGADAAPHSNDLDSFRIALNLHKLSFDCLSRLPKEELLNVADVRVRVLEEMLSDVEYRQGMRNLAWLDLELGSVDYSVTSDPDPVDDVVLAGSHKTRGAGKNRTRRSECWNPTRGDDAEWGGQ